MKKLILLSFKNDATYCANKIYKTYTWDLNWIVTNQIALNAKWLFLGYLKECILVSFPLAERTLAVVYLQMM